MAASISTQGSLLLSFSRFAQLLGFTIAALLAYVVLLGIYRLTLHPLARVPGPKLAALTRWVETYYECFYGDGGQFMWHYRRWHQQYGSIIRITPDEIHIDDPEFYDTLYSQSSHADKLERLEHRFNNPLSSFATPKHSVHRHRRAALNPFFSKRKISLHAPNIQAHMNKLCHRLESEVKGTGTIITISDMWGCFTSDIVVGYCLEKPYNFIMRPNFRAEFSDAMVDLLEGVHFVTQFPWAIKLVNMLPESIVRKMQPAMGSVYDFNNEMADQIRHILVMHDNITPSEKVESIQNDDELKVGGSMFTSVLSSSLPPSELSLIRLQHEAISVIGAGIETTMRALSLATFHIASNSSIQARLRAELRENIADPELMPSWEQLQQLPYLSACIDESLRLSYGTSQRMPRLFHNVMKYEKYSLPAGTIISMDNYDMSHCSFFPDSHTYSPDRWLESTKTASGKPLSKYLTAFGRGTRSCVGMQLAYADLYIGLASLFRRCEVRLHDTERDSVDLWMDLFVPRPRPGTKGVRVTLN